jgi:hypothetical protein
MNKEPGFLKKPIVQASLIGAFGGMVPKLIEMIPKLFANVYPSTGQVLALALLAFIGGVIVLVYKEGNFQKALILGAGAPAILATLTAQALAPNQSGFLFPNTISFFSTAYAQTVSAETTVRIVITQNESPYKLNALWLRADRITIDKYRIESDTLIFSLPLSAKEIRFDLPAMGGSIVLPVSELLKAKIVHLKITNDKQTKDFWETFGNAKVAGYRIERQE